jgi:hypothetical protein
MALHPVPVKQLDPKVMEEGEDAALLSSPGASTGDVATSDGAGGVSFDSPAPPILTGATCEVGTTENDLMYIHSSGEWRRGLVGGATVEEARVLGIAKNVSGTACDIVTTGVVDGFTSRTIGSPQYLDKTTPGAIVETKPSVPGGGFVFMGVALTATKIVLNIEHVGFT